MSSRSSSGVDEETGIWSGNKLNRLNDLRFARPQVPRRAVRLLRALPPLNWI